MNIVKTIEQYDQNCVYFCDPIKNNIMNDGKFIRILYSNKSFVLNGIYLLVNLKDICCFLYYNKYKCTFDPTNHTEIIDKIKKIEEELLKKANIINKIPQFMIYDKLINGNIKAFCDNSIKSSCSFILKISGIWETGDNYGLTYKFITPLQM
jgi:hypothetical protein